MRKPRKVRPLNERLWEKVDREGPVVAGLPGRCWLWQGATVGRGYGHLNRGRAGDGNVLAHRAAYELEVGPIPAAMTIDHLCDTPLCVNPAHLAVATRGANALRGGSPAARQARQTHCVHGHEFTAENTRWSKGHRSCRICDARRERERTEHRRAALGVRICAHCGRPLPGDSHGRRRYCDKVCASRANEAKRDRRRP